MMSRGFHSVIDAAPTIHPRVASRRVRILCATDLSETSEHALQRALQLARQLDGELLLLHVVDERQLHQVIELQADRARGALQQQVAQFASLDWPDIEISVRVGNPHKTIANIAKQWCADLVVLGAYRKRTGDQFVGTTSERVARAAMRPVLIVNGQASGPYQSVLLASDLSDEFVQVAHLTQRLGFLEDARASLVHALAPVDASMLRAAGISETRIEEHLQSIGQTSRETLLEQMQSAGLHVSDVYVTQGHARPFGAIERAVEDMNPQLLVMGTSRYPVLKRLLSSSVVSEVLRKIECDVLIASPAAAQYVRSTAGSRVSRPFSLERNRTVSPP